MRRGFTLIEVCISMAILFLVIPLAFTVLERLHAHSVKIATLNSLKQSSAEIFTRIEGDMHRNGNVTIRNDNHGLLIKSSRGPVEYILEGKRLLRKQGHLSIPVGSSPVIDATFISHGESITVNLALSSYNTGMKREEIFKTRESIRIK